MVRIARPLTACIPAPPCGPIAHAPALGSCTRQGEEKGRAVPLNTLHRNLSRMRSDYLLHNIQA